ncbi:hypothetical protein [Sphingomonas sp. RS2018]
MAATDPGYPDGIAPDHADPRGWWNRHANLLSLAILGLLMALALSGLLGGAPNPVRFADLGPARLTVAAPTTLRNGLFFEMRWTVAARADIGKLVVAIPPSLWRDMTVNSMIPAAGEERFADGRFRFHYGALKAGETLEIKIDGQINPPLTRGTAGDIALYDGDRRLGAMPVRIRVLP